MNISKPFIERPVATTIIMLALVIFGWFGYRLLPISELPTIDFPTIVVSASLPGADPQTMASTVATPLEKQLSTIAGLNSMSSTSTPSQTRITLQFSLDRNIDAAAQDVQTAISQASRQLPRELPTPPSYRKVNPALSPILFLAMTADHLRLSTLDDYAEIYVAQRLSMVSGVAQVDVYGSQQYAVRIRLNPYALATRGLDLATVVNALQNVSTNQPNGTLETPDYYHLITVDGQLLNAQEYNEAAIANVNGALVRVKDIGYALDSVLNDKVATWLNHDRAIVLAVQRQPNTNTVHIVQNVFEVLPKIERLLPGGVHINVLYDRSAFIKASLREVQFTLLLAIVLVMLITYLFLNNLSSTLITLLDFPTSIIATFGVMYLLSYSLNNISLMGLVLVVGFVIDDTIVVLENILRHLEAGANRVTAAIEATQEISFTVVSMTLSLVAVFIPILFMGGLIGRLFHEFAVVVATAILFSGFVSLTLTPMLRSRYLTATSKAPSNIVIARFLQGFEYSKIQYRKSLSWSLDHPNFMWNISIAVIIATALLFYIVPKGFIPSEDTGLINATTQVKEGMSFPNFVILQKKVTDLILSNPNVTSVSSTVGQGGGAVGSTNNGQLFIRLKPFSERNLSADKIIQQLRPKLNRIPGIRVTLQNPPAIRIGGMVSASNYQYVIQGSDWNRLEKFSQILQTKIAKIPGVQDLNSDLILTNPELKVHILRDRAAQLGITPQEIETALFTGYGERQINTIDTPLNQYQVITEIDPIYQKNISALSTLYFKSLTGTMVPLGAFTEIKTGAGALSANHYGQLPAVTLSFGLAPGVSLGAVTNKVTSIAKQVLPEDLTGTFVGTAQTFQESMKYLPLLLLFTVLVIYMILGILYEHFIHPLTILTALPFAAFGALLALLLTGQELDIFSFIGIIMLVGLVKKNGIIMIDFALDARRKGLNARDAIVEACTIRYRPIMMTTMAAILGVLPIAVGFGPGSEARRPLGIAVVGGLLFSQTLTLYVTPLFYITMEKYIEKFRRR